MSTLGEVKCERESEAEAVGERCWLFQPADLPLELGIRITRRSRSKELGQEQDEDKELREENP